MILSTCHPFFSQASCPLSMGPLCWLGVVVIAVLLVWLAKLTSGISSLRERLDALEKKATEPVQKDIAPATTTAAVKETVAVSTAATPLAPAAPSSAPGEIPKHHLVSIFAVVSQMTGSGRIRRISFASARTGGPGWSTEGRRAHFSSHHVR